MGSQPRATTIPAPFSFGTSQAFEGNDGSWSTFVIRVGTPEQVFHVMISTAGQETWVPVPQGNGEYGFDTVGLQLPDSGGISLQHQIVAGIATKDFLFGIFALGPKPTNFTSFDNPQPSYLYSLANQSIIPSLSWGYTAGASYQLKGVPGSLTLGGYDESRFTANNLSFIFSADDSKPLTLGLQAIEATNTFQGVVSLLPQGILTFIDSTVPEIWLPIRACEIFEAALGLQYDDRTQRYLVNETVHANLTAMNPVFTFKLGNDVDTSDTIVINLPYKAFDLQASWPIYDNATNYFPVRRADNDTQYTLGRTFLQEAYIIADYERGNFSISQCLFEENTTEKIIPIYAPFTETHKSGLSNAIIAVIVVVVVAVMIIGSLSYILFYRWRKRKVEAKKAEQPIEGDQPVAFEVPGAKNEIFEVSSAREYRAEMPGVDMCHELAVTPTPHAELSAVNLGQ
ncbi:hypothetical protein EG329_005606 [Mollisiaceae sp. DMI_Dod_QoI]|nr:hypothetical protein EG329_005606 [Helotiales sp. DMI_Dod_QoI]